MEIRTNPNFNSAYKERQQSTAELSKFVPKTKNVKIDNNDAIILQGGMIIYV